MRFFLTLIFSLTAALSPVFAAGPIETSPYAVQGVEIDVQDVSAAAAKDKALIDVQFKALVQLGTKMADAGIGAQLAQLGPRQVLPLLKSLSIEKEVISPGHYKGTFTVRFLPNRVKPLLANFGVRLPEEQGRPMLIIPVWTDENGQVQLWEDNPWRQAWINLNATQAQIPLVIPLGDVEDHETLAPSDVTSNNVVKLEAMRRRYDVKTLLIAFATSESLGGIHAQMVGSSPLGKINIDKVYTADSKATPDSAALAAERFQTLITEKFRSDQARVAAAKIVAAGPQSLSVTVPFNFPSEWNGLRARILAAPGVQNLDVNSLDISGASAQLFYSGNLDDLIVALQAVGLQLAQTGSGWTVVRI
jgi:hypothetical protein